MPIHVLPEEIVSQIAAGEVVERPSSVVKELVENSIDAGAREIRVEARAGGKRYVRVSDDGCGIPAAEVELAFRRHSTSKLTSAEDLAHITTLGFRGEALASIAAVSRVTCETRAADEPVGTLLRLEGGQVVMRRESGRPPGTSVIVEDLFFNLPARRKFLRADRTEQGHIDAWLTRYALAYPELRFTLVQDGKEVFRSPGNGRLRDVLIAVYGLEVGAAALEIVPPPEAAEEGIQVYGFVSPPSLHRANRGYITIFVNGRWIQDALLSYAIVQAYHTLLPAGRYPLAVVMVRLPPEEVDVNVHPAKSEVRFRDGDMVFRAVQKAVRRTLSEQPAHALPHPHLARPVPPSREQDEARETRRERLAALSTEQMTLDLPPRSLEVRKRLPPLRVVGQVSATYIVAEGEAGMYLIDQHAAHERVLFEQLLAERKESRVASQVLLEPRLVQLSPEAASIVSKYTDLLERLGFLVEPFGGATLLVRALPAIVAQVDPLQVIEDVAAALSTENTPMPLPLEDAVLRHVCKRAAIKAGQVLTYAEMEQLVRALEQCVNPHTCPHGRPTMILVSMEQLTREFGR